MAEGGIADHVGEMVKAELKHRRLGPFEENEPDAFSGAMTSYEFAPRSKDPDWAALSGRGFRRGDGWLLSDR